MGWEESGRTAVILQGEASTICSKQHTAPLRSSHVVFSLCISLASIWCIHIVVWSRLQLYRIDQTSI